MPITPTRSSTCRPTPESFHVDLELTRGLSRKGRVVDPDGKPVDGGAMLRPSATWGQMATLADDTFEVLGLDPDHPRQLIFAHKDAGWSAR